MRIVIGTETLTFVREDGSPFRVHAYSDPAVDLEATLTEVFGFEPTRDYFRPKEDWPVARMSWEGFTLNDRDFDADTPVYVDRSVDTTVASVRSIAIEFIDGTRVGDPVDHLAQSDALILDYGNSLIAMLDRIDLPNDSELSEGAYLGTSLQTSDRAAGIQRIRAPEESWGA